MIVDGFADGGIAVMPTVNSRAPKAVRANNVAFVPRLCVIRAGVARTIRPRHLPAAVVEDLAVCEVFDEVERVIVHERPGKGILRRTGAGDLQQPLAVQGGSECVFIRRQIGNTG